jgi:hydrogenase/urease accessory protein HupE
MRWAFAWLCLNLLWGSAARAHNFTMSVLELREVRDGQFQASWERLQGIEDARAANLLLRPQFPEHCTFLPPELVCSHPGLQGKVGFAGLGELSTTAMIRVRWLDAPSETFSFSAQDSHVLITGGPARRLGWARLARSFTWIGLEHIWFGWDHLLFVLGLLWLVRTRRALLLTITSFTLAHSLTLSVATLGFPSLPVPPVEAVIALSIVFVAVACVRRDHTGEMGWTGRAPWLVAFAFGLLHGFGFASALSTLQLPQAELPIALLFFNVGVELGQITFVGLMWLLRRLIARGVPRRFTRALSLTAHYAMGTAGMYWVIERVLSFRP